MNNEKQMLEQLGPRARLQAELLKLESQRRELWILIIFSAAVLALGALSFLVPTSMWRANALEIRISPQVLFVIMVVMVVVGLYMMRREVEVQKLRLTNLLQTLQTQSEQAAGMTDAATNVFNRSFLRELLQGEVARAERNNRPLALMMCDCNNFKHVNDQYGHLMGDYVLAQIAGILKSCVRGSDYVIRYGGDEFLILLPETDQAGVDIVRNRVEQKVADWDRENRPGNLPISLSIGVHLHVNGQTPEQDVGEVDARMYASKQGAKNNKVAVASPTPAQS